MVDYGPHDYVRIILMHEMWVIVIVSNDLRNKDFQRIFIVLTNQIIWSDVGYVVKTTVRILTVHESLVVWL